MIDITKTYKTFSGNPVKLLLIEGEFVHGLYRQKEEQMPVGSPTGWVPMLWVVKNGFPCGGINDNYVEEFKLVESKEVKQISHTIFVGTDGFCSNMITALPDGSIFARFTINAEIEEGSNKVFYLQDEPDNITKFNLTHSESRALQAIACYGTDAFLKVFYEKLGKHYLQPNELSIRSLFAKIQKALPSLK